MFRKFRNFLSIVLAIMLVTMAASHANPEQAQHTPMILAQDACSSCIRASGCGPQQEACSIRCNATWGDGGARGRDAWQACHRECSNAQRACSSSAQDSCKSRGACR